MQAFWYRIRLIFGHQLAGKFRLDRIGIRGTGTTDSNDDRNDDVNDDYDGDNMLMKMIMMMTTMMM